MAKPMTTYQLQLWGDTQSGKTTLLTSALFLEADHFIWNHLDRQASRKGIWNMLDRHAQQLSHNQLVEGTEESNRLDIDLEFSSGHTLQIRDMKGGNVTRLGNDEEIQDKLSQANGILFVVNWSGTGLVNQMSAVERVAKQLDRQQVKGLAFTKCEQALHPSADAAAWHSDKDWWKNNRYPQMQHYESILSSFGDAVWATSSFGFDRLNDSRPACLLNEFGHAMPYLVNPKSVVLPFAWFLNQWELT